MGRAEYEITSLSEGETAVLIGRGWECLGWWRWRVNGASFGAQSGQRVRVYWDVSRPEPARIPNRYAPTHFRPLNDIETPETPRERLSFAALAPAPSPAHAVETDALDPRSTIDRDWQFVYAPPGYISRPEAEHRIVRALRTAAAPGVVRVPRAGFKSSWPVNQMIADWGDYPPPVTIRAFEPSRRDLDDWYLALSWFAALGVAPEKARARRIGRWTLDQKIVALRAATPAYSWRQIGDYFARSNTWARKAYQAALDRMWRIANTERTNNG